MTTEFCNKVNKKSGSGSQPFIRGDLGSLFSVKLPIYCGTGKQPQSAESDFASLHIYVIDHISEVLLLP